MGFAEKNIRKPEDIKGKTVAVTPGDSMSQIWPLFLKKTGLKETDFKTVSGDAQTKLNAVINGQADLLLGYVMDQAIKLQDATHKPVYPIRFADYGVNMVSSGIIVAEGHAEGQPRSRQALHARGDEVARGGGEEPVRRPSTRCSRQPEGRQEGHAAGGLEETTPLYTDREDEGPAVARRPKNMDDSLALLVEYGGLDACGEQRPEGVLHPRLPAEERRTLRTRWRRRGSGSCRAEAAGVRVDDDPPPPDRDRQASPRPIARATATWRR